MKPWRDPWVWLAAGIIALALASSLAAFLFLGTPPVPQRASGPVVVTVIAAPTPTPTPMTRLEPTATPTPIAPPPPPNGSIVIGAYVQVRGTDGDGLRLRAAPGLKSDILALAKENEIFQVVEGPHVADGYTWWRLVSPKDSNRGGWTVANYLSLLPTPPAPPPTP